MDPSDSNHNYLSPLSEKLTYDNKYVVLLGEFNACLLKYGSDSDTSDVLDLMFLNALLSYITSPTWVARFSGTIMTRLT